MSKNGGYLIIDCAKYGEFEAETPNAFANGIFTILKENDKYGRRKRVVLSGVNLDGAELPDFEIIPVYDDTNTSYVAEIPLKGEEATHFLSTSVYALFYIPEDTQTINNVDTKKGDNK